MTLKKDKAPSGCSHCEASGGETTCCRVKSNAPSIVRQQNTSFTQKKLHPMARRGLDNLRYELFEIPEAQRTATEESAIKAIEFLLRNF